MAEHATHFVTWRVVFLAPPAVGALLALTPSYGLADSATKVDCEAAALTRYTAAQLKLNGVKATPGGDPTIDKNVPLFSIERTIAGRRLEEDYCLKAVACERRAGGSDMEDALNFVRCIDDEDKERVLSHLQDGSDAERQEAITRLKDE
jgi:hypothetical protein